MLGLNDNGHKWRGAICRVLGNNDCETDAVTPLFLNAAIWAKSKRIEFDEDIDHIAVYLGSLNKADVEPIVPMHLRLYLAEEHGIELRPAQMSAAIPSAFVAQKRREPVHHRRSVAQYA